MHCCLACFEKCVKYISRKALVITALRGWNFCKSCGSVFHLLASSGAQIAMVTWISAYLLLLGKLVIVGGCFTVAYVWLTNDCAYLICSSVEGANYITSPILPSVVASILGFFVAAVFLEVFDCTIESILISFLIDQEMNDGSPDKPYMCGGSLQKYMHGQNAAQAARQKAKEHEIEAQSSVEQSGAPI